MVHLDDAPDDSIEAVRNKERMYEAMVRSGNYLDGQFWADAWCAAFVWKKTQEFNHPLRKRTSAASSIIRTPATHGCATRSCAYPSNTSSSTGIWHFLMYSMCQRLIRKQRTSKQGGMEGLMWCFGNPPWERVKLQEKEWFAERSPEIANASNAAARKRLIESLRAEGPYLHIQFLDDSRKAEGESHMLRNSGRYPLCGRGDINVYTVFAEWMRYMLSIGGRVGCVLPSGIATDDTTKYFFQDLMETSSLVSFFDFENKGIFDGVHNSFKFCLFTSRRGDSALATPADFVFFAHSVEDIDTAQRRFTLSANELRLLSPKSGTMIAFRSRGDRDLTLQIRRNHGPSAGIRLTQGTFHSSNDSGLFSAYPDSTDGRLGLLEPRMFHICDHRYASYEISSEAIGAEAAQHQDPHWVVKTRYWVPKAELDRRFQGGNRWTLAYRRIARSTDERTMISSIIPTTCANENTVIVSEHTDAVHRTFLLANLCTFCADYALRQRDCFSIGNADVQQLPLIEAPCDSHNDTLEVGSLAWVFARSFELIYTAWDLQPFAQDCGWSGPPFRWDEDRRFLLRCELDAAFFHLYLPAEATAIGVQRNTAET